MCLSVKNPGIRPPGWLDPRRRQFLRPLAPVAMRYEHRGGQ